MAVEIPPGEFFGIVLFRNYIAVPWNDKSLAGIIGECKVVPAEQMFGFRVTVKDSNWVLLIQGPTMTMTVPGCEVLNFTAVRDSSTELDFAADIVRLP